MSNGSEVVLYRRHASGGIGTWRIWNESHIIHYAHAVSEGGAEQVNKEEVEVNRSGRSLEQQIQLQVNSRISRMLDKGYKRTRDEALNGATNQLGFYNPMLAQPIEKVHVPDEFDGWDQIKFDGHRCLIRKDGGEVIPYSRKGKIIKAITHIVQDLAPLIPEGVTMDGELYRHGWSLQKISSASKTHAPTASTLELRYQAYDVIEDLPYGDRLGILKSIFKGGQSQTAELVRTQEVHQMEEVMLHFREFREQGYEGAMLRLNLRGYEDGLRSNQLLKVKEWQDEDFLVVDIIPGKHNVAILRLDLGGGKTFDCLAPGTVSEKQATYLNKASYIRRKVTVEFACRTEDGVPFHGVALRWVVEL